MNTIQFSTLTKHFCSNVLQYYIYTIQMYLIPFYINYCWIEFTILNIKEHQNQEFIYIKLKFMKSNFIIQDYSNHACNQPQI